MLELKDIKVKINETNIIKGVNLNVKQGELHALIGPNGSGKSSLANAIVGREQYETTGSVKLNDLELLELDVTERAKEGVFMSFQSPPSIPGITNYKLLSQFSKQYEKYLEDIERLKLQSGWAQRDFNDGASGGEKKKNEILQLLHINPKLVILDELDTGLDVDALKIVKELINEHKNKFGWIVISHNSSVLRSLNPTHVHILKDGKITNTGSVELLNNIDEQGFSDVGK
ncbi:MAG: Fe-S cluster assembly ATPase SufC [Puniceicoccaceae bacterium]|nr:Fe-S cluster assembly ATPase SufC [Puniceicoccaceae bacterium]